MLNSIILFDKAINTWFLGLRTILINRIFFGITFFGEALFVVGLVLIISYFLWQKQKQRLMIPLWMVVVGSEVTAYILKLIINRPRPLGALVLEHTASFPSGHATIAVAFYGFLTYWLWSELKSYRVLIITIGVITIFAIGLSRLYLGVHYLSDVLAGYLIGAIWLMIVVKICVLNRKDKFAHLAKHYEEK